MRPPCLHFGAHAAVHMAVGASVCITCCALMQCCWNQCTVHAVLQFAVLLVFWSTLGKICSGMQPVLSYHTFWSHPATTGICSCKGEVELSAMPSPVPLLNTLPYHANCLIAEMLVANADAPSPPSAGQQQSSPQAAVMLIREVMLQLACAVQVGRLPASPVPAARILHFNCITCSLAIPAQQQLLRMTAFLCRTRITVSKRPC